MHLLCTILIMLTAGIAALPAAEQDHSGHDHSGQGHGDEGRTHALGTVTVGDLGLAVTLFGEITPGGEAVIGLAAESGQAPSELRSWIGVANGRGSVKALLQADEHGHFHGHLEVPDQLPADSALWVGVVTDAGRERASVALPAAGHEH